MKFRMTCPKCGSTNFSIERDNRSYAPRGQTFEMIFSCRCGKQMFGDQIVKEYERQKKDWEAQDSGSGTDPQVRTQMFEDARPSAPVAGFAGSSARPRPDGSRLEDEDEDDLDDLEADEADEADEDRAQTSAAPPGRTETRVEADADEDEPSDGDHCGWAGCTNPPRPNSKYCSRDCSNKNARLRYKQRKGTEKEAA